MKQLKLEVGKTYRNKLGHIIHITAKIGGLLYPFVSHDHGHFTEDGRFLYDEASPLDLIEEVEALPETRHTFAIPDGVKKVTVEQVGNRIVVEMVPEEKEPKPGDVMINDWGGVYILKEVKSDDTHMYFVMLGKNGHLFSWSSCFSGRPATPEEAQPLFDALKKAGKRWNAETMEVEEISERYRIMDYLQGCVNVNNVVWTYGQLCLLIEGYLNKKEAHKG